VGSLSLVCVFVYVFIRFLCAIFEVVIVHATCRFTNKIHLSSYMSVAPAIPPGTMSVREHRVAKLMK